MIGCGDVALRLAPLLRGRYRLFGLARSARRAELLRDAGVTPVPGDLDEHHSLARLAGLAHDLVHLAPPPGRGERDTRTANLIRVLRAARSIPQRLVYISTSGVYGDCAGAVVREHRPPRPQTDRARRRADAERQVRQWGRQAGISVVILRVPGIYAGDRLPLDRLRAGTPVLEPAADPNTNHIHADDLARAIVAALARGRGQRAYNVADGSWLRMGEYFDLVADAFGLPRPERISREAAAGRLSDMLLSFMSESRRLDNRRLRCELRVPLRFPSVEDGVRAAARNFAAAAT